MNAEDEGPLLAYLASARNSLGRTLYDAQYALRLARQRRKHHACVALFCELRLYEVSSEVGQGVLGVLGRGHCC